MSTNHIVGEEVNVYERVKDRDIDVGDTIEVISNNQQGYLKYKVVNDLGKKPASVSRVRVTSVNRVRITKANARPISVGHINAKCKLCNYKNIVLLERNICLT